MADFLHELEVSGLGWKVVFADAQVQGAGADRSVADALVRLDRRRVDVIALVRGGGAKTDLASFDSELIGRTIAMLDTAVVTGIGHEIDTSVADLAAHTSLKTPTACAAHLVGRARHTVDRVEGAWTAIRDAAVARLDHLDRANRSTAMQIGSTVRSRVAVEQHRLDTKAERLARGSSRAVADAGQQLEASVARLRHAVPRTLRAADATLTLHGSRLATLDPHRLVMRGWSITTREDGTIVRSVEEVKVGDVITTSLADGAVTSTITASAPATDSDPVAVEPRSDV